MIGWGPLPCVRVHDFTIDHFFQGTFSSELKLTQVGDVGCALCVNVKVTDHLTFNMSKKKKIIQLFACSLFSVDKDEHLWFMRISGETATAFHHASYISIRQHSFG